MRKFRVKKRVRGAPLGQNARMATTRDIDAAWRPAPRGAGYWRALVGTAAAVVLAIATEHWLGLDDLSLIFMLAVLVVAVRSSTGPAVLTAVLCFFAYNFFFIEPRYTFYIGARQGVVTVLLFLVAALLAGRLASQLSMRAEALRVANLQALARQMLARRLAMAADERAVLQAAHEVFTDGLGADVWLRLDAASALPAGAQRVGGAMQAATVEDHGWWFLPIDAPDGRLGTVGLKLPPRAEFAEASQRALVASMVDDVSQALQRTRLVAALETERVAGEAERLRSALLSSVSHDLRTPLASIMGAAGTLASYGAGMDDDDRRSLLDAIRSESARLDRYIQNLLDMTRLEHGGIALNREWIGVDELVGAVLARLQRERDHARFVARIAPDTGAIHVHAALLEQALFNVIENAAKFTPRGQDIAIEAARSPEGDVRIDVCDRGPGIPEDERARVFDMFYSVARGDRGARGTGLGLAICRGIVVAHGGDVEALAGDDGVGTRIRLRLPPAAEPESDPE